MSEIALGTAAGKASDTKLKDQQRKCPAPKCGKPWNKTELQTIVAEETRILSVEDIAVQPRRLVAWTARKSTLREPLRVAA